MCPTARPERRKRGINMKLTITYRSHRKPIFKGKETREYDITEGYTAEDIVRLFTSLLQDTNEVRGDYPAATIVAIKQG